MTDIRIAILSSSTVDLLRPMFQTAVAERGLRPSFWFGGFGQYLQEALTEDSGLYQHKAEIVILYLDGNDVFQELLQNPFEQNEELRRTYAANRAREVEHIADAIAKRIPNATLFVNTVAVEPRNALWGLEYNSQYGLQDAVHEYNRELGAIGRARNNVVVTDIASVIMAVGFDTWSDYRMWFHARARCGYRGLQALAQAYTGSICARLGRMRKCIVLDLDNTLWGGIIGEDGPQGLKLGEEGIGRAFVEFQQELLNQHRKGVLLAICSKNNVDEALSVVKNHRSMRLREEHFAASRINWLDKATNLRELAAELNIGLDSLVFIDDNPAERAWVRESLPEVLVPEWPSDPGEYRTALLAVAAQHFQKLDLSSEDRNRGEAYQAQAERRRLESSASSLEDFYGGLKMRARIGLADRNTIPRIAQLTQKTNQFNLTTRRYTEAEIGNMAQDPRYAVWWIDVTDRFGPNGIVGVLIFRRESTQLWSIDTFLLSCRVMGRTVEDAFLAATAREMQLQRLQGEFRPTAKNAPVRDLYSRFGFRLMQEEGEAQLWELNKASLALVVPAWIDVEMADAERQSIAMGNSSN